jgi:hypothetical protein
MWAATRKCSDLNGWMKRKEAKSTHDFVLQSGKWWFKPPISLFLSLRSFKAPLALLERCLCGVLAALSVQSIRWQAVSWRKCFYILRSVTLRSERKEAFFQMASSIGKAANLFSASRKFRARASLAGAHGAIVFFRLHLSLSPSDRKAWAVDHRGRNKFFFCGQMCRFALGTFLTVWYPGKIHPSFHVWGQPQLYHRKGN